jgi:hypothetical protein
LSKFTDSSPGVAAALSSGVGLEAAAEMAGVSATTVRGWLRRGKREPDGPFGEFGRAAEPSVAPDAPFDQAELERHLVELIRSKKSVTGMNLWLRLHGQDGVPAGYDPLLDFLPRSHGGRG